MKTIELKTKLHIYENIAALEDPQERLLCRHALAAQNHAYALYSGFRVGSAVLLEDGNIIEGSNQENAVYPLGLCAERVAINSANTLHQKCTIKSLALITDAKIAEGAIPTFPCGSCRQVIAEQEYRQAKPIRLLVLGSGDKIYVAEGVESILPFIMTKDTLG